MTDVLIKRELLERELLSVLDFSESNLRRVVDHLIDVGYTRAAPRQPEGEAASILLPALRQYMHNDGSGLLAGYEYERTQQIVAELREECERLRVKLMTIASAEPVRHNIEWAKAMAATGNNEAYAKWREAFDQRDKLAGLLREVRGYTDSPHIVGIIDAALAEVNK